MLPEAKKFMDGWHAFIEAPAPELLDPLIAGDCLFRSPAFWNPKEGREATKTVLMAVVSVVSDFRYTKEWVDGREIILEFEARAGDRSVKGIDRISLNGNGEAIDFEVLVRPLNGLMELAGRMGQQLGQEPGQKQDMTG